MKKIVAAVLALCIVGGTLPAVRPQTKGDIFTASAEELPDLKEYEKVTEGPLTYFIFPADPDNGVEAHATVEKCDSSFTGDLAIPETIQGVPVVAIGNFGLYGCSGIKKLSIPASVVDIALEVYRDTWTIRQNEYVEPNLIFESVEVDEKNERYSSENGVLFNKDKTEILRYPTFDSDKEEFQSIMEYDVPDTVIKIGKQAFCGTYVRKVTLPDTVESIGVHAFADSRLEEINIPSSLKVIPEFAFEGTFLKSVDLPATITNIGEYAFKKCRLLESVTIPDTVEEIGEYAFYNCENLTDVKLPKYLGAIEEGTFCGCKQLKSIELPNTLNRIGGVAFAETGLEKVTIPSTVQQLGSSTLQSSFGDCPDLKAVTVINPGLSISNQDVYNSSNSQYTFFSYSGVIFGQPDSAAQQSAEEAGVTFIPMNVPDGNVRVTLIDYDTGELIPDSYVQEHEYTFGTDIGFKEDDVPGGWIFTGPFYNVPSNPYVFKGDLPSLFADADRFTITTPDPVLINHYTNETFDYDFPDSMDIVIRVKTAADSYLQPGQVEVKLLDYDTGKPLELTDKFDYALPLEIRSVDPETGEYTESVSKTVQVTSNHFICGYETEIKPDCELTAVNIDNSALPTGYKCPTSAGEIVKNGNGSYTVTVRLMAALPTVKGDANLDGNVNIADAVLVMQAATNPDKYGPDNAKTGISKQGFINADVDGKKGLSNNDALLIQKFKLCIIDKF